MWRGVGIFLVFVLTLSGWGLFFYQWWKVHTYQILSDTGMVDVTYAPQAEPTPQAGSNLGEVSAPDKESVEEKTNEELELLKQEKDELERKYAELLERVERIEKVYQKITKENADLKTQLEQKDGKIAMLTKQLNYAGQEKRELQARLQALEGQLSAVKLENRVLKSKVKELQGTLNSMDKLKQAMRDLRLRLYLERKRQREEARKHIKGNRGYVIYNGRPTLGSQVESDISVEVIPVFD